MIGKNWTHAGVLGLLLLLTVINDIYRIGYTVRYMRGLANAVQNPVSVRFGTAVINRVAENAAMAGSRWAMWSLKLMAAAIEAVGN